MRSKQFVVGLLVFLCASFASASGLAPWSFGMTKEEVVGFTDLGPYKTFSNGDIETYNGVFDGGKENVQFFFVQGSLRRIGIYLYEGNDVNAARAAWIKAYTSLKAKYGDIEVPDVHADPKSDPINPEVLSIAAALNANLLGKTVMAPKVQPTDMRVGSTIWRHDVQGVRFFYVSISLDRAP